MWFRLYDDLPDDLKLDGFTPQQKWLWVVLMCMSSRSPVRGTLRLTIDNPLPVDSLTRRAEMTVEAVESTLEAFREREMIHRDGSFWVLSHWDQRQYEGDSSTERTRLYRDRKRNKNGHGDVTVTSHNSHENVTVTPPDNRLQNTDFNVVVVESGPEPNETWLDFYQRIYAVVPAQQYRTWFAEIQESHGVTDALIIAILQKVKDDKARNPPAYARSILAPMLPHDVKTVDDWQRFEAERETTKERANRGDFDGRAGAGSGDAQDQTPGAGSPRGRHSSPDHVLGGRGPQAGADKQNGSSGGRRKFGFNDLSQ